MDTKSVRSLRALGGVSTVALSVGMAPMALAQDAPPPPPPPTPVPFPIPVIPDAPLNVQECAFDVAPTPSTLVCAPGTDADGFQQNADGVDVTVEAGAQVQGEIQLGDSVFIQIDGDIVNASGSNALDFGDDATIVNNGLVNASPFFDAIISVDERADLTNNGTINSVGNDFVAGVIVGSDSVIVNDGLIALDGNGNVGILGGIGPASTGVSVTNTADGQIIMDGRDTGIAVAIGISDDAVVVNEGLIQVEGPLSGGVLVGENSSVTNSGDILVNGDTSIAVIGVDALVLDNSGFIVATGDDSRAVEAENGLTLTNTGAIEATGIAIDTRDSASITNELDAFITTTGDGATIQAGDSLTLLNNGTIRNDGSGTNGVDAGEGLNLTNTGAILASGDGANAVRGGASMALTNSGAITAQGANGVTVDTGAGSTIDNSGTIASTGAAGVAVILADTSALLNASDASVTVSGLDAIAVLAANDTVITNSGTIEATGDTSQAIRAAGDFTLTNTGFIAATGGAVDVVGVADITNEEGGAITAGGAYGVRFNAGSSLTNRGEISGATGVIGSAGDDFVANFGAITGTANGVSLGEGEDEFQQWTGASVAGNVALGGGNDTFVLEGASSSIAGVIDGGAGSDRAILAGVFDSDNFVGFETYQLGSTLGGTLDDVDIDGARTLDGDVVQTGVVNIDLGVDTLTATGSITLEETAVINIATPLDEELVGQEVLVLQEGTTFTDNGATINIIDDDLLLDYTVVFGSLSVQVDFVDPILETNTSDVNITRFGNAVEEAYATGTLGAVNFAALNAQPDVQAYTVALAEGLPSLSDGVAREIFESGSLATQGLERHLAGDEPGAWGQIAVRGAHQDARGESIDGYDSDQTVFTIGSDIMPGDSFRFGVLASYAEIDVEDETATGALTNDQSVESYRIGGYLSFKLGERGFSNTEVSYLTGSVDSTRSGALGTIRSSYDFDGVAARSVFGYDVLPDENVSLTPTVGFNAAHINFDDLVEAGGFNFEIAQGDARFFEARIGAELAAQMSEKVSGFIQGTVVHDLEDSARSLRLDSAELRSFFVTQPVRERDRFELSAGANIDVSDSFSIEVGYLGDFNDGYSGHSARASARIAF